MFPIKDRWIILLRGQHAFILESFLKAASSDLIYAHPYASSFEAICKEELS